MSSSGELTTERIGRLWSPMSASVLAHDEDDDEDDNDDDDDDDHDDDLIRWVTEPFSCLFCLFSWSY